MMQTAQTNLSLICLLVRMPNENKPSKGPYVMLANFKIKSMINLSLMNLNTSTIIKNKAANVKWTFNRFLRFSFSVPGFLFRSRMSMQKQEVIDVIAPSTLGNNAEI